jgi:hypothetical protein
VSLGSWSRPVCALQTTIAIGFNDWVVISGLLAPPQVRDHAARLQ